MLWIDWRKVMWGIAGLGKVASVSQTIRGKVCSQNLALDFLGQTVEVSPGKDQIKDLPSHLNQSIKAPVTNTKSQFPTTTQVYFLVMTCLCLCSTCWVTLSWKNRLFRDILLFCGRRKKKYGRTSCLEVACVTSVRIVLAKANQVVEPEIIQVGRSISSHMACPCVNGVWW